MPNLGLNLGLGVGGGVSLPASQSEILQWLKGGVEADGITLIDKRTVVDEPELRNVNCLAFTGTEYIEAPASHGSDTSFTVLSVFKSDITTYNYRRVVSDSVVELLMHGGLANPYFQVTGIGQVNTLGTLTDGLFLDGDMHLVVGVCEDLGTGNSKLTMHIPDFDYVVTATIAGTATSSANNFNIGKTSGGSNQFLGSISTSAYFDYAFTAEDVSNYLSLLGTSDFAMTLEEGYGLPYDVSGNNNNATINTAIVTTEDGIPSWNHSKGFSSFEYLVLTLSTILGGEVLNIIPDLTQIPA